MQTQLSELGVNQRNRKRTTDKPWTYKETTTGHNNTETIMIKKETIKIK